MLEKVSLIKLGWLVEAPMWEKVPLIRLKAAVWDESVRIRCIKFN